MEMIFGLPEKYGVAVSDHCCCNYGPSLQYASWYQ